MLFSRLSLVTSALGLVLVAAAAPGCSSSDDSPSTTNKKDIYADHRDPVLVHEAVNADQKFADDVVVSDDRLVIATAGHEALIAKIKEGTILAGNRTSKPIPETGDDFGPNPYGFLRTIVSVATDGANTVFTTKKASLDEWLEDGDIDFSDTTSLLGPGVNIAGEADTNGVTTKTLKFLSDDNKVVVSAGSGFVAVNASLGSTSAGVKLSNGKITLGAKYDGYMKVRYKELRFLPDPPTGVSYKSLLTLDPSISADIEFNITNSATLAEKTWTTKAILIPLPGPIPTTLRLEPEIKCSLSASGQITATINASIGAHAATGFEGDATFTHFDVNDISEPATPTGGFTLNKVTGKESLTGKCEILAKPSLLAFDAVGLQGKIGPYVSLTAAVCGTVGKDGAAGGFTLSEEHGISGEFGGRIQVPIIGVGKDFKGLGVEIPLGEHYLVGTEKTCEVKEVDSCQGKSDGFHCSEVNAFAGIVCKANQIEIGLQCDPSKKCTGGTATTINCK